MEPVGLKTYLLIRIGLDVEKDRWFEKRLEPPAPGESLGGAVGAGGSVSAAGSRNAMKDSAATAKEAPTGTSLRHPWLALDKMLRDGMRKRKERMLRRAWEQEEARRLALREQTICQVETELEGLAREIAELAGDMDGCLCVYEDSVRKALVGEGSMGEKDWFRRAFSGEPLAREAEITLPVLWERHFPVEEFQGYTRLFWVKQLFPLAKNPHFVILGTAPCLPELIEAHAHRMKSLRWILTEAEGNEEILRFVEEFYTEYGLAVELHLVEDTAAMKRLRLFGKEPVSVVDFTGETYVAVPAMPEGSVWLDMRSVEEKRRRILAREGNVAYFSMKELWKIAQKRCNCPVLP